MELLTERLEIGKKKYGHGVRVRDNPQTWGVQKNSWMEMAQEEFLDGIVYVIADFIREIDLVTTGEDDNHMILFYAKNTSLIDSYKHRYMVESLFRLLDSTRGA